MSFGSDELLKILDRLVGDRPAERWLVAFSGGLDSTVLLHSLAGAVSRRRIIAIHVNHGLHPDADQWQRHCASIGAALGVPVHARRVEVDPERGDGPEAAARAARYEVLRTFVEAGDCLLSAHHRDDQAETLLLNLLRGSGAAGLAGIAPSMGFGRGRLLRPLLEVGRGALRDYAVAHDLAWIEDPTNADTRFDRNYLRNEVLPLLTARWPAAATRIANSARLLGESSRLDEALADVDIDRCGSERCLDTNCLGELGEARSRNLLRRAARRCGLAIPPASRLQQIVDSLVPARADAAPLVAWPGAEVRRYRDRIYLLPDTGYEPSAGLEPLLPGQPGVALGEGLGMLALEPVDGAGLAPEVVGDGLAISWRTGGEAIRLDAAGPARKVKKLFQEAGILPWMRGCIPLLHAGNELVAVGDDWLAAEYLESPGFRIRWHDKPALR